ncbi:hypothetical protein H2198_005543 [Neophaeococcomyces mojaviensis]|uniref:Uncharacterized protein n=1 Tax=Neophaeococcomyces mojaviensis TaxID=3383035 RepID=A0ACC3A5F9_9EURO|nr:hypothetical protein H2198_005543 [Knufia sp. JES_112]
MKSNHTINGLKRWSCKTKTIPDISAIKNIHVYDFDNTLFSSPLPNPQLWHSTTIGLLQAYEVFAHGGWWHNPDILASTGDGLEAEEPRAWKGWWNEVVVSLAETSIKEEDTLTVLLTGRGETNFANLINRIADARHLDFDLVVLKPEVGPQQQQFVSTMEFKQAFLKDLVFTYRFADNIRIYEDRVKHVKGFRDYMEKVNKAFSSSDPDRQASERTSPCAAEVVHVCELKSSLDPQVEVIAVQRAINRHNEAIKTGGPNPTRAPEKFFKISEQFLYFGYLISQSDSARLITLCNAHAHLIDSGEVKYMASSILIAPFYPRKDLLEKVGGRGNKVTWQVTGVAKFEDRIWAARVTPVSDKQIHTQDDTPMVVLAIRKGSRQIDAQRIKNWQPPGTEKQFIFETVVGDKVMLKVEEADEGALGNRGNRKNNRYALNNHNKRKFGQDDSSLVNKENQPQNHDSTRNENTWAHVAQGNRSNQQAGTRSFQKTQKKFDKQRSHNQFNNNHNSAINSNAPPAQSLAAQSQANTPRQRGTGTRKGGRNGGPGGYKSLDDYGGPGFDGANDAQNGNNAAAAAGAMVMNY